MSSVFVIVNESMLRGNEYPVVEYVQPFHTTMRGALDTLAAIAEDAGLDMNTWDGEDQNSVKLPVDGTPYTSDEYYIEEVEVCD